MAFFPTSVAWCPVMFRCLVCHEGPRGSWNTLRRFRKNEASDGVPSTSCRTRRVSRDILGISLSWPQGCRDASTPSGCEVKSYLMSNTRRRPRLRSCQKPGVHHCSASVSCWGMGSSMLVLSACSSSTSLSGHFSRWSTDCRYQTKLQMLGHFRGLPTSVGANFKQKR